MNIADGRVFGHRLSIFPTEAAYIRLQNPRSRLMKYSTFDDVIWTKALFPNYGGLNPLQELPPWR